MKRSWFNAPAEQALERAYSAFAERYPEWVAALFDRHFLSKRLRLLLRGNLTLPGATVLALWWADHLGLSEPSRTRWAQEITPAAAFFLEALRAELASQQRGPNLVPGT